MNDSNFDAPAVVRRRRRIARQQREKTPEPAAKVGGIRPKISDDESSSTTTTPNEFEKRRTNPAVVLGSTRVKSRTASNSSGGESRQSSNLTYREKILSRRDRGQRPATAARSQSTPREIPLELPVSDSDKLPSESSGNVVRFFQKAKRSLSIPRFRFCFFFTFLKLNLSFYYSQHLSSFSCTDDVVMWLVKLRRFGIMMKLLNATQNRR